MDNQERVNRRRRRNLPAELKVEIVDCLPLENAAHFLANVPNRLIIHHCAPRIRRILKMIYRISADYVRTLPAPNSYGHIHLRNGHKYTQEMDIFLRYISISHCDYFAILRGTSGNGFVGYPVDFFNDLIKYYCQTKVPAKALGHLRIYMPLTNPAPWPAALIQPQAGEMNVEEVEVDLVKNWAHYILHNKHSSGNAFKVFIHFEGDEKRYQQMTGFVVRLMDLMTGFVMWREDDVQSREA